MGIQAEQVKGDPYNPEPDLVLHDLVQRPVAQAGFEGGVDADLEPSPCRKFQNPAIDLLSTPPTAPYKLHILECDPRRRLKLNRKKIRKRPPSITATTGL